MEENKKMEEEQMDENKTMEEGESKEEKNLGIEIRIYVNKLMSIQKRYEKAEMMLKVAKKSTVRLMDDENNLWDIKEILGADYKTVEGIVENLLWTAMNECEKEFKMLKGEHIKNNEEEKSEMEIEQEGKKKEVKEKKEEVKGKEREEKKVKKETEKKKPIDKGKVITLHNAKWTNAKIADEMGISEARVSQILKEARERMK